MKRVDVEYKHSTLSQCERRQEIRNNNAGQECKLREKYERNN